MPDLKLVYFKMRALAEAPQLMLHYSDTPYSYEMGWDYFGQPWSQVKSSVLYRQLPLLVVNESTEIFQSGAITRYLAELTGLKPDDALLLAEVDALYEASQELFRPLNPTINFAVGEEFLSKRSKLIEQLAPRFEDFERILARIRNPVKIQFHRHKFRIGLAQQDLVTRGSTLFDEFKFVIVIADHHPGRLGLFAAAVEQSGQRAILVAPALLWRDPAEIEPVLAKQGGIFEDRGKFAVIAQGFKADMARPADQPQIIHHGADIAG